MQIGSSPISPANTAATPNPASTTNRGSAAAAADTLAQTIAGYYDHLQAKTPVYASLTEPGMVHMAQERDIQDQLGALADRIKFLLIQGGSRSSQACAAQLDCFMDHIRHRGQPGKLSTEQAQYFYSDAFKGGLEQNVARADMAAPEDQHAATQRLEALCQLIGQPIPFFNQVVGAAVIDEFAAKFSGALERKSGLAPRGGSAPSGNLPEGAARI
jgi:hypothetical protein